MRNTCKEKDNGITLIALVVTIIILLILAGVSISVLTGNNGIIGRSTEAVKKADISEALESIKTELMGKVDNSGKYTNSDVIEAILKVTGNLVEENAETTTTRKGNIIEIGDLWGESDDNLPDIDIGVAYSEISIGDYVEFDVKYDNVASTSNDAGTSFGGVPIDKYKNKWRILSSDNRGIKLISAGVPLNYKPFTTTDEAEVFNLTNNLFNVQIKDTMTNGCFCKCGFKKSDGSSVTTIEEVEELFSDISYIEKVRLLTKEDIEDTLKTTYSFGNYLPSNDLFSVPTSTSNSNVARLVFATNTNTTPNHMWGLTVGNVIGYNGGECGGTRIVIILKPCTELRESDEMINGKTTWYIEPPTEEHIKYDKAKTLQEIKKELKVAEYTLGKYTNQDVIDAVFKITGNSVEEYRETINTLRGNTINIKELWLKGPVVEYSELSVGDYVKFNVKYDNIGNSTDTKPNNKYKNNWRILSIKDSNVELISAGVPLSYKPFPTASSSEIDKLTNHLFEIPISSSVTDGCFYKCGLKKSNGDSITTILEAEELFSSIDCFENVRVLSKEEMEKVLNASYSFGKYLPSNDLFSLPTITGNNVAPLVFASLYNANCMWSLTGSNVMSFDSGDEKGIRMVVTLKAETEFWEAVKQINGKKTWNIEEKEI